MRNYIVRTTIFVLMFFVLLSLLDGVYERHFRQEEHWNRNQKQMWIYAQRGMDLDVGFIGSSRVVSMVDVKTIERITDLRAINLGCNGCGYAENHLLLESFFRNGNRLGELWVNVDVWVLDSERFLSYPFHDYLYMPFFRDTLVKEAIADNVPRWKFLLWSYLPFSKYAEFNHYYRLIDLFEKGGTPWSFQDTGGAGIPLDNKSKLDEKSEVPKTELRVVERDVGHLEQIIESARKRGVTVRMYYAPEFTGMRSSLLNREKVIAAIESLASKKAISFYDYSEEELSGRKEMFQDNTHLNARGVGEFTTLLCREIQSSRKIGQ